jgi:toxin YoeB
MLSIHPQLGRESTEKEVRIKVVKDYLILYKYSDTELRVMSIFDSRQDPEKFKKRFKK